MSRAKYSKLLVGGVRVLGNQVLELGEFGLRDVRRRATPMRHRVDCASLAVAGKDAIDGGVPNVKTGGKVVV